MEDSIEITKTSELWAFRIVVFVCALLLDCWLFIAVLKTPVDNPNFSLFVIPAIFCLGMSCAAFASVGHRECLRINGDGLYFVDCYSKDIFTRREYLGTLIKLEDVYHIQLSEEEEASPIRVSIGYMCSSMGMKYLQVDLDGDDASDWSNKAARILRCKVNRPQGSSLRIFLCRPDLEPSFLQARYEPVHWAY
jgi:hypothetical protein